MKYLRWLTRSCVVLATLGLLLPGAVIQGAQPSRTKSLSRTAPIGDVELDAAGTLHGVVIDVDGVPVTEAAVEVWQGDRMVARTATNASGCFSIAKLPGGICLLKVGSSSNAYRTWVSNTAPPKTSRLALVIVGGKVVRGQMPLGHAISSNGLLIAGLVAAAIAIPIAIRRSGHSTPASP